MYIIGNESPEKVSIYKVCPKAADIKKFKVQEISIFDVSVFWSKAKNKLLLEKSECCTGEINHIEYTFPNGSEWFHSFRLSDEVKLREKYISNYLAGKTDNFNPCILYEARNMDDVSKLKLISHFLLVDKYHRNSLGEYETYSLAVPESLYILQCILYGDIKRIDFSNPEVIKIVSQIIKLFEIDATPLNLQPDELYFENREKFQKMYGVDPYNPFDHTQRINRDEEDIIANQKLLRIAGVLK